MNVCCTNTSSDAQIPIYGYCTTAPDALLLH